jgi:predicted cupin superfamily sugar epimerase
MSTGAAYWVEKLRLLKHVEGGYYREIYRSPVVVNKDNLPKGFRGNRNVCTAIYFLLEKTQFSAFHRIASDEIWHFYSGDALRIYEIQTDGTLTQHNLGKNAETGQRFQTVIKAGNWFASHVTNPEGYCLAGCTVSPGFDFEDFEIAEPKALIQQFPQYAELINRFSR